MELENTIFKLSCELYSNLKFSKCSVQFIITILNDFIKSNYNPILLKNLKSKLKDAVSEECMNVIEKTLNDMEDSFKPYSTEQRRLSIYKNKGLYTEPTASEISDKEVIKLKDNKVFVGTQTITKVHLSLKESLTTLFKIEGLLEATLEHMEYLESEKNLILDLVNGTTWQEDKAKFIEEHGVGVILMPLIAYFDDLMVRNAMSAHAGNNQLGCLYSTIPCFPPSFVASKLISIIVTDLFYSKDRKKYGNVVIVKELLEDLSDLRVKGINLPLNGRKIKIYFITSLIVGDNLGINSLLGFTESFSNTMFCRICYVTSQDSKTLVKEDETLLRTVDKYEEDVKNCTPSLTGLKESCAFNVLETYHCIERSCLDLMHDGPEGFFSYDMASIILRLTDEGVISVQLINAMMRTMDFSFENNNRPMDISLDYLKANQKLKMNATECTFFTRYFAMIVGGHVYEGNGTWDFYLVLRQIVHIITSPVLTKSLCEELQELVEDHHRKYMKLFGDLKPKHHLLTHYASIIKKNGPIVKLSSMRFESKHTQVKEVANAVASNVNLPVTIGSRIQLSLMDISSLKYEKTTQRWAKKYTMMIPQSFFH